MVRATLVGLWQPKPQRQADEPGAIGRTGHFGNDVIVRHIIGLDPARRGVAVASELQVGMELAFCQRNLQAARADLKTKGKATTVAAMTAPCQVNIKVMPKWSCNQAPTTPLRPKMTSR